MNRINRCLTQLQEQGKKALVTYIVNGDPALSVTLPAMHSLVESGVDMIELGVPFSDPMAEGPVIQRGHERALAQGASLKETLAVVREFRQSNQITPVILMGYLNPIERMGYGEFAQAAYEAGVDGLLTVDLPPEEAANLSGELQTLDLESIFLMAPTTSLERMDSIAALAKGFIYYVSLKGVTGAGHLDVISVQEKLRDIRSRVNLPLLVGFGIKDAASARAIAELADGVVVGSVLVDVMGANAELSAEQICEELSAIIQPIRAALDES